MQIGPDVCLSHCSLVWRVHVVFTLQRLDSNSVNARQSLSTRVCQHLSNLTSTPINTSLSTPIADRRLSTRACQRLSPININQQNKLALSEALVCVNVPRLKGNDSTLQLCALASCPRKTC